MRTRYVLVTAILALIGAGVLVYSEYKSELNRVRATVGSGSKVADTAIISIEYAEQGDGPALLSIHGAGGGYDQGLINAADLVGPGFHIIAPSRFGYLRTPIPADTSPAAQADAHAALLSKLQIPAATVVGVSAGARSAIELALRHPDRVKALVLIVPGTYSPESPVAIEASRGSKLAFWLVNTGADFSWWALSNIAPSMLIRFLGVRPELVAAASETEQIRVRNIVKSIQPLSLRFPGINIDSTSPLQPLPLENIAAPTLVISARDDLFNTAPAAKFAASRIRNAQLIVYDTGGHLLVGRQEEARAAIRGFLDRIHPGNPQ
jgi:pimeloyl-ACP methyl ester carboxylesterase